MSADLIVCIGCILISVVRNARKKTHTVKLLKYFLKCFKKYFGPNMSWNYTTPHIGRVRALVNTQTSSNRKLRAQRTLTSLFPAGMTSPWRCATPLASRRWLTTRAMSRGGRWAEPATVGRSRLVTGRWCTRHVTRREIRPTALSISTLKVPIMFNSLYFRSTTDDLEGANCRKSCSYIVIKIYGDTNTL